MWHVQYADKDTTCMHDAIREIIDSKTSELVLRLGSARDSYAVCDAIVMPPPPEREVAARGSEGEHDDVKNDAFHKSHNRTYFTKKPICRVMCTVSSTSILQDITSKMLGPRTDFDVVMIDMTPKSKPSASVTLLGNITNSVQTPQMQTQLGIVVVDVLDAHTRQNVNCDELSNYV